MILIMFIFSVIKRWQCSIFMVINYALISSSLVASNPHKLWSFVLNFYKVIESKISIIHQYIVNIFHNKMFVWVNKMSETKSF